AAGPDPHLGLDAGRRVLRDPRLERLLHLAGVLARDEPERQLGVRLAGDDGLAAGPGVPAPDAVDLGGRPRPDPLERAVALLAVRGAAVLRGLEPGLLVEREPLETCSFIVSHRSVVC